MDVRTFNITTLFAGCYFFLLIFSASAQSKTQPLIKVAQMEYAYDPQIVGPGYEMMSRGARVILATDTLVAARMKQSFLKAIDGRWNAQVQSTNWDLKRVNPWNDAPKFKPKLKSKEPGSWHLFFQLFDNGLYPIRGTNSLINGLGPAFESLDTMPYHFRLKVVLLDGANGETVFSNEMNVEMLRTAIPDGQLLLRKVPGMTASFLQAFDTAMQVFFGARPVSLLKLPLVPAFVFIKTDSLTAKAIPLAFKVTADSMVEEPTLRQQWVIQKITTDKLGRKGKFGKNLLGGTFTRITGVSTERVKAWKFMATIGFNDKLEGKQFTCKVPYIEEERDERIREKTKNADGSKSYSTTIVNDYSPNQRFVDTENKAWFFDGADTVGSFQMRFGQAKEFTDQFTHCWDGRDSTSITTMPEYWNNSSADAGIAMAPVFLEGSLYGKSFLIQNTKGGNQLDLLIDGRLLATIKINYDRPLRGFLFRVPDDTRILKAMCMLSSLPFRYFY